MLPTPASDVAAFDALYRAEFGRLAGALRLLTGSRSVAEEVAQDVFERAWARWRRVEKLDRPEGWLYTTGFRLARRKMQRAHVGAEVALAEGGVGAGRVAGDAGSIGRDPAGGAVDRLVLERSILALPERQRQAVVARHVLGFSTEEAAAVLGVAPDALRQLLRRGVAALRLSPELADPEMVGEA